MRPNGRRDLLGPLVGHITNPPGEEISSKRISITLDDDEVSIYSLLVAVDNKADRRYYYVLRVIDRYYYSPVATHQHVRVMRNIFGNEPSPEESMSSLTAYSGAVAELVDVAVEKNGVLKVIGPKSVPRPGCPVHRPRPEILRILLGRQDVPISVGILADSESVAVSIDLQKLLRHTLIVGTTGTGKSWLRGVLLEKIFDLGVPQLIFDPLRDYVNATHELGGTVIRYGVDFLPALDELPISLFEALLKGVLTPLQTAVAVKGFELFKKSGSHDARDLLNYIEEGAKLLRVQSETKLNAKTRVESILRDLGYLRRPRSPPPLTADKLAKMLATSRVVDLDLLGIGDLHLQVTVATILSQVLELRSKNAIDPLLVSFDEAHRIAPRLTGNRMPPPSLPVVRNVARFGRHYGIGLIVITQYPDSVDVELIRLPSTRIIFALDPEQASAIRGLLKDLPPAVRDMLAKLEQGTAFLTGTHDVVRHTLLIRITNKRRTTHGGETPKFRIRKTNRGLTEFWKPVGQGVEP